MTQCRRSRTFSVGPKKRRKAFEDVRMGLLSCHLSPLVESIGFGKEEEEEGPKQALQFTACTKTETVLGKKQDWISRW